MGKRISNLERALKLTQVINSTLEQGPLLDIIVKAATELTDTESASIMLLDPRSGELVFEAATAVFRKFLAEKQAIAEREAKARERTEEMLKHDQRRKKPDTGPGQIAS